MRKRLILCLLSLLFGIGVFAQQNGETDEKELSVIHIQNTPRTPLKLFVRAGMGISGFIDDDYTEDIYGAMLGAGLKIPLDKSDRIHLKPELRFVMKGGELKWLWGIENRNIKYDDRKGVKFRLNYLGMPVNLMFSHNFGKVGFDYGGGFYIAYGIGGRTKAPHGVYQFDGINLEENPSCFGNEVGFRRFDCGLTTETNFHFHQFFIGFGIEYGLVKLCKKRALYDSDDYRNVSGFLNIGYNFSL